MINKIKNNKLLMQIIKFLVVGGIAFIIDYLLLIVCKEVFNIDVLISAAIAFSISVIFNYIFSILWVFSVDKNKSSSSQFVIFFVLSVIGLIITEIIMWIGTSLLNQNFINTTKGCYHKKFYFNNPNYPNRK